MGSTTLQDLRSVVEQLEIGPRGSDLVEAFACLDVLTTKITTAVAAFDAAGGWQVDHAANMASWLTAHVTVDRRTANRVCGEGRRLRSIPVTMQAWVNTEPGSVIETALRLARPGDKTLPNGTANAAALESVCRFFLDNQSTKLGGRHRPHVNVLIDLDQLDGRGQGCLLDGTPISPAAMRRILCDSNIHRVITSGQSAILDYGRSTRTIPPALFTALVLRDRHCRMPGCEQPPERCDVHHVIAWEKGGPTCLTNTILVCPFDHHNKGHGNGWHMQMDADGTLHITDPNGTRHTTHPPGTRGNACASRTGKLSTG